MVLVNKDLFVELHGKYENLKAICKQCFFKNIEDEETKNKAKDKDVKTVEMPELDEHFDIVLNCLDEIIKQLDNQHPQFVRLIAMQSSIFYEQAKTLVSNDKETHAKELLEKAIGILRNYSRNPIISFLYLRVVNHLSYLLSKNNDFAKASALLEESENIYKDLKIINDVKIFNSDDLFVPEENANLREDTAMKLEKLVTNNLQMLGWIYSKQKMQEKFAKYHHLVLRRQLEMRDGNALIWSLKTARLASYFVGKSNFRQARHHLAAATAILEEYEIDLKKYQMTDSVVLKWKELQHYYADIAKCWTKYGLYLFNVSKNKMVQELYGDTNQCLEDLWVSPFSFLVEKTNMKNEKISENVKSTDLETPKDRPGTVENKNEESKKTSGDATGGNIEENTELVLEFPSLRLIEIENQVSCKLVRKTEDARSLFLFTHMWLKRSKVFYTIKDHPLEYINGILDLSELYRYLAFFEEDIESQYSVQKRRADSLETLSAVLREIRPQCYIAVSVELLRELAEVQMEMMGLNLRRLYMVQENTGDTATKRESTLHKMEAVADIHARLEHFGEIAMPGVLGQDDFEDDEEEEDDDDASVVGSECEIDGDDEDSENEEGGKHSKHCEHGGVSSQSDSVLS